jgi:hypothetical protein
MQKNLFILYQKGEHFENYVMLAHVCISYFKTLTFFKFSFDIHRVSWEKIIIIIKNI